MALNEIEEYLYTLPIVYSKSDVMICRDADKAFKYFQSREDIATLKNKERKMELLKENHFKYISNCYDLGSVDDIFCLYKMDFIDGFSTSKFRSYKFSFEEKKDILLKTLPVMEEVHAYNGLINDVHSRNFIFNSQNMTVQGIDPDNFQVGDYLADELPDFMQRFVSETNELSIYTDKIAFLLMTLDMLSPLNIDLDMMSVEELWAYVESLDIPSSIRDMMYDVLTKQPADLMDIITGINSSNVKTLSIKAQRSYYQ